MLYEVKGHHMHCVVQHKHLAALGTRDSSNIIFYLVKFMLGKGSHAVKVCIHYLHINCVLVMRSNSRVLLLSADQLVFAD